MSSGWEKMKWLSWKRELEKIDQAADCLRCGDYQPEQGYIVEEVFIPPYEL